MAITHFTPQLIGRGSGRSAVLSAAYRHCARMEHEAEARVVDYSNKRGLRHEAFMLPAGAPAWARNLIADRSFAGAAEAFWNLVEHFETRADAQFAKEFVIALPVELTREQNIALVNEFVETQVLARGQIADWVYHDEGSFDGVDAPRSVAVGIGARNPHIHLMTTLRPLTEDGFGSKRQAVIGDDGQPVRNKAGKIVYKLWSGEKSEFLEQRQGWLDLQNKYLALAGLDIRVDGRSYVERGIDIVPTTHIGVAAKAIDRKSANAEKPAWSPKLDRIQIFEERCAENLRRIDRRPEIVIDMISRETSVFTERDVAKILHRYVDDPNTFRELMARVMQNPEVLRLEAERVAFSSGLREPAKYTTRELIKLEADMASRAAWLAARTSHGIRANILESTFARHDRLSVEQRAAIEHVGGAARIAAIVGRAGAGKTTMMKAAREAWEAAGYRVVGGALAGKAAEGLEREAGIVSRTLSSWELSWQKGKNPLDDKTIFVLDEAGMVSSRQMALFVDAAVTAGAKLVLVGDPDQLQPIEAGAAFRAITDRIGYAELETIYRQREQWMRDASLDLARGRIAEALGAYDANGRLQPRQFKMDAIAALIEDWNRDYDPAKSTLILAHLRRDVRALNDMARSKLVERGIVGDGDSFKTEDGVRKFASGDQIVFLKNDNALGVKNGMIARVVEAKPGWFAANLGEGEHAVRVEVDQRFYASVDHGYATTIHKSQGATVDRVKVLASLSLDRHLTYVALTRHREDVGLYYGARSFEKAGGLTKVLSQRRAKETTLDYRRSSLYRAALTFAEARGLHIVRVARTLVADKLRWTVRQKQKLADLGQRFRAIGVRLGLVDGIKQTTPNGAKEVKPMVDGITTFPKSIGQAVEDRLAADPAVARQWTEVSTRFRLVFADPEAAFRAVNVDAMLTDGGAAKTTLSLLAAKPETYGVLRGKTGLLAAKNGREERQQAEANVPALVRDLDRYLRLRNEAEHKHEAEERAIRLKVAVDIPALSSSATQVLEDIRDAIGRNDLPAALEFALADRMVEAELDGFARAVSERFGERTLLTNSAKSPDGPTFDQLAVGMDASQRESLREAWPAMRTAQQLAALQRTAEAQKQAETMRQTQSRGMSLE